MLRCQVRSGQSVQGYEVLVRSVDFSALPSEQKDVSEVNICFVRIRVCEMEGTGWGWVGER